MGMRQRWLGSWSSPQATGAVRAIFVRPTSQARGRPEAGDIQIFTALLIPIFLIVRGAEQRLLPENKQAAGPGFVARSGGLLSLQSAEVEFNVSKRQFEHWVMLAL